MNAHREKPAAIFVMGPTGAGKTALAVELVKRLPVEIVSVDSAMIYRGLDIGTAKPGPEVLALAPHRLIDILDPPDSYSAAQFREDALAEMAAITRAGRIPLLVGGTGLYFRVLEEGIADMPAADAAVRARLAADLSREGLARMHARLARIDPASARRIHPNDPQRTLRALEVYEVSGVPLSRHLAAASGHRLPYGVVKLVLAPSDRGVLHDRLRRRFEDMLGLGLVGEVAGLITRWSLTRKQPALRIVGYREVASHLAGELDFETMVERAVVATRQLAKRQLTWLRAVPDTSWLDSEDRALVDTTLKYLGTHPMLQ